MADVTQQVQQVFAEVTRYPMGLLKPTSRLEDDLGIDSVKRAEVFAALSTHFELPTEGLQAVGPLESIAQIVDAIETYEQGERRVPAREPVAPAAPTPARAHRPQLPVDGLAWAFRDPARAPQPAHQPTPGASVNRPPRAPHPDLATPSPELPFLASGAFAGKVALVTGSGHGLGKVLAQRLAHLGAKVVVNSFHSREQGEQTAAEIREAGGEAVHLWGSVANPEHLENLFTQLDQHHHGLDFFISNASNGLIAPLDQISPEHWDRAFRTNVVALHQGALLARPRMRKRGGGRILCISSPGAQRVIEHFGCMGPVKAALESLVRYLAVELGEDRITVNAVSAGPLYGDLLDRYPDSERLIPYWQSRTNQQQLCTEEDIANSVTWLLSPLAATMTGSTVLVDHGGSQRI